MRVTLALLADYANVSDQGKLNILGVFDRIIAAEFPARHTAMQLVIRFEASPAERGTTKSVSIKLLDPDARELISLDGVMELTSEPDVLKPTIHQIIGLEGVQFPKPGDYAFHILVNEEERASIPLTVESREHPVIEAEQGL